MAKHMLINASHPEETRVVVLSGRRLEEFDYESAAKKQLKGNIYLAKVTRVEASLQAAFVEYGGNRHGFLPFSEIHPDYYRIPIADREALIAEEAQLERDSAEDDALDGEENGPNGQEPEAAQAADGEFEDGSDDIEVDGEAVPEAAEEAPDDKVEEVEVETRVDVVGGDEVEDDARKRARFLRRYKIQEVIKRRQVMLVQVAKEERGNKGAALTTYLSLAGRYCVLMPNTGRGGGISRKIGSASDRRRLKKVMSELDIAEGMAVIVRTAGSLRSKVEIRRDYQYLVRLWNEIREITLQSTSPALIHEEANLLKRSIRDLYSRDMDEILVEGEDGYKAAKAIMKNLMPSHARKVKLYDDEKVPLFHAYKVESQLDAMHTSSVQLKSGGYIVINPTEALVAIDVNSGKATRERHIEETALKTNIEAAEEVALQLRLRDLAGLIVVDFIDMEEGRHNREVERRFKEAMRHDRARIQLGRISPFGLLEMSRQRLRPSLFETSTEPCGRCGGTGFVRTTDSTALHVLRALEDEGIRRGGGTLNIALPTTVALYVLNEMRARLTEIEQRYGLRIHVERDAGLVPPDYNLERLSSTGAAVLPQAEDSQEPAEEGETRRRRGRRRRRRVDEAAVVSEPETLAAAEDELAPEDEEAVAEDLASAPREGEDEERHKPRRRRGKRGGRRRSRRRREAGEAAPEDVAAESIAEGESDAGEESEAEALPGGADLDDLPAPGPEPEAEAEAEPEAEAETEAETEKPRKPRRRARKSPPAEARAEEIPEAAVADQATTADQETGEEAPSAKRPRRRRVKPAARGTRAKGTGRKVRKPAAAKSDGSTEEIAEPAPAEPPALAVRDNIDEVAEPEEAPPPEAPPPEAPPPEAPPPEAPPPEAPALERAAAPRAANQSELPKRRGWWQRWV